MKKFTQVHGGVLFQTSSGQVYVYNTATNQIITLDSDWYCNISDVQRAERVFQIISDSGVPVGEIPDVINWPMNMQEYLSAVKHFIPSLILEVTQECTLRCGYCVYSGNYYNMRKHSNRYMNYEVIKRSLDFYAEHSRALSEVNISFYGGEALIRLDEVKYAVAYARRIFKDKSVHFHISSNGTTLTGSVTEWLNNNEDVGITVTLNGLSHDKYRRFPSGEGSLDVIERNLFKIRLCYPRLWKRMDFIANVASLRELLDLRTYYMEHIGKPPLLITGILAYGGNENIRRIINTTDAAQVVDEVHRLYFEEKDPYIVPYYDTDIAGIEDRAIGQRDKVCIETASCMPFTSSLFISAAGEFGVCEKAGACSRLGNIYQGINTDYICRMLEAVWKIMNRRCRECWCQRLCTICLKDFQISPQGEVSLPESLCLDMRESIKATLKMFCELGERNSGVHIWQ